MCSVSKYDKKSDAVFDAKSSALSKDKRQELLKLLIKKHLETSELEAIRKMIIASEISARTKLGLLNELEKRDTAFAWAVADYIAECFRLRDLFKGTANSKNAEEVAFKMRDNIRNELSQLDDNELLSALYYICRTEHEKYPDNTAIEAVRVDYLKEKVM